MAILTIDNEGQIRQVELSPEGALLGRSATCEIVLASARASRRHARVFRDPFDRWLIQDLDSRNGVWIREERIEGISVVHPGQSFRVGSCKLTIEPDVSMEIEATPSVHTATSLIVEPTTDEVLTTPEARGRPVATVHLKELNAIVDRIGELGSPRELYPEVCDLLARGSETVAVVIRLPGPPQPLPPSPTVLACSFGGSRRSAGEAANLHLSRRVLESVRTGNGAVMASNAGAEQANLGLTIVDDQRPRAVLCAPVTEPGEVIDLLYLDVPGARSGGEYLDFLQAVAKQVSSARKGLLLAKARSERALLDQQLALAREIQQGLTPTGLQDVAGADVAVHYQPAMWVGGDYCDVWPLPDGRIALAVGDVSGKGLAAAMVMTSLQAALRATMSFCTDPAQVMERINDQLERSLPDSMFVTFFLGLFDPAKGELSYVNAGHVQPVTIHPSGQAEIWDIPANRPLGIIAGAFEPRCQTLSPGTGMVIVTDGITEATSPEGELLGVERLCDLLQGLTGGPAEGLTSHVVEGAEEFRQTMPQQDDITVLSLYRPSADAPPPAPAQTGADTVLS